MPSKYDNPSNLLGKRSQPDDLVKGCPCYKEFDDGEKVCLNNDDVVEIKPISIAKSFFSNIESFEDLQNLKTEKENVCYLLVYLDDEKDKAYCVSKGEKLVINGNEVHADDLRDALQFVNLGGKSTDGEICSTCMYKYLVTLSDVFEGVISEEERTEIIANYISEIADRMAQDMTGAESEEAEAVDQKKHIQKRIVQLMEQRADWEEMIREMKAQGADTKQVQLVDNYRQLNRLETTFLSQVQTMMETDNNFIALNALRMMIAVAEKATKTCNRIRGLTNDLEDTSQMPDKLNHMLKSHAERRRKIEHRFDRVGLILSEMES